MSSAEYRIVSDSDFKECDFCSEKAILRVTYYSGITERYCELHEKEYVEREETGMKK